MSVRQSGQVLKDAGRASSHLADTGKTDRTPVPFALSVLKSEKDVDNIYHCLPGIGWKLFFVEFVCHHR